MMTVEEITSQRAELLERCAGLSEEDRRVLEFLSVYYVPAGSSEVMRCADRAGLRAARGQRFQPKTWNALLGRLGAAGLLMEEGGGLRCHLLIAEVLMRRVASARRLRDWARAVSHYSPMSWSGSHRGADEFLLRDLRLALCGRDTRRIPFLLRSCLNHASGERSSGWVWDRTLVNPFDAEWMRTLPRETLVTVLFPLATVLIGRLEPADEVIALIDELCAQGGQHLEFLEFVRTRHRVLTGRLDEALELSPTDANPDHVVIQGWVHMLAGDDTGARGCYEKGLAELQRGERRDDLYFRSEAGLFYVVSLLRTGSATDLERASDLARMAIGNAENLYGPVYATLMDTARMLQGECGNTGSWVDGYDLDESAPAYGPPGGSHGNRWHEEDWDEEGEDEGDWDEDDWDEDEDDWDKGEDVGDLVEGPWEVGEKGLGEDENRLPPEVARWTRAVDDVDTVLVALSQYWQDPRAATVWVDRLEELLARADSHGYRLPAAELAELLFRLTGEARHGEAAARARQEMGTVALAEAVELPEPWERALTALAALTGSAGDDDGASPDERLVWLLGGTAKPGDGLSLEPRVQKRSKRGGWTKGRGVSLEKLYHGRDQLGYVTDQDSRVCECLQAYEQYHSWGRRPRSTYRLRLDRALRHLVGHPLVFLADDRSVRVELVAGTPELQVAADASGEELVLQLVPAIRPDDSEVAVMRESPTRFRVVDFSDEHMGLARILGPSGQLRAPASSRGKVLQAVEALASLVTVQSAIGGGSEDAETVVADSRPHVQLLPQGEGLVVVLRVCPLGPQGPAQVPGSGGATVFGRMDDRQVQATRDLEGELRGARAVMEACPGLDPDGMVDGQWTISDVEDCLELLLQLRELGDGVVVEWPQGERFRVTQRANLDGLRVRVRRERDWFQLSAQLPLDEDVVLDMRRLLELSREAHGRFLPLGEGQFLALTAQFRRRLAEIDGLGEAHGDGARFHRLMTPLVEELLEGAAEVDVDAAWEQQRQRLSEASLLQPAVPSTLQARLRDYQVAGYQWLAQLSHWGVGACLADDMGLGKTVQALATILDRAPDGPTLVVAPTSVGDNWVDEARRFAPTLRPILLRDEDRPNVLEGAGAFDLVVCSYALLHRERQGLAEVPWQTVVLDEAQAIKNPQTRRAQAAMALQAEFRLITTGTPVENHLGELWSLFRFLNPGLLGGRARFNERFARPIERDGDAGAVRRLRRVLQPFILRRLKSEVLEELPPRTEVTRTVEMSPAEAALYEALRQEAVTEAEASKASEGQRYVQILAQIMRLRRACCHPRLALPDTEAPCAKLEVFTELLRELLEGGHRALVFSQFVDYLAIVREALEEEGVSYQYLDGSTPARGRRKRIDAFQAGEGDVFLISLRAGGQGLNLTAADYVIHLDPWWNPAVEDQASDRAHRIGQERPVTVYRLVTRGTIEESIVALHAEKRELADGVLEGTGTATQLSSDELLALMRG